MGIIHSQSQHAHRGSLLGCLSLSAMVMLLGACGGGGGSSAPTPRTLQSLAITPAAPSVALGLKVQLTATATYSDNTTENLTTSVQWSSATQSVASIDTQGMVTPVTTGSTVIRAASGSVFGTVTLQVTPAVLQSIAITPNPAATGVGIPLQFQITGSYSDGSTKPVTTGAVWSSDTPASATIDAASGVATGVAVGSTTIAVAVASLQANDTLSVVAHVWAPTGSMTTPRLGHTATLLTDGTVLIAGGMCCNTYPSGTEVYDPLTSTFSARGSLPAGLSGHTTTLLPDGRVLLAGGGQFTYSTSAEIYDPVTGTWSAAANMNVGRAEHTATLLANGRVLIVGGNSALTVSEASAEIFDPATGTWTLTGSLSIPRRDHTATLLPDGTVLVAGGHTDCLVICTVTVGATTEIYDPVAGTWSVTGSMSTDRMNHTATLLSNGTVLVAGGTNTTPGAILATAEIYDPTTKTWTLTGSLGAARYGHAATLLTNGTLLVAGGTGALQLASAEFYDPLAGTWSAAPALNTARAVFTLTVLQNGTVLAAGGFNGGQQLSSAEIYYP